MKHLDAQTMSALAARQPDAVAYFREHLASPCERCEEFLAQHSGPELLDGQAAGRGRTQKLVGADVAAVPVAAAPGGCLFFVGHVLQ